VPDTGGKEGWSMKRKTEYTKAPKAIAQAFSNSEAMEDFLPSPDNLVFKEEAVKVTLSLGKESVIFFKKKGQRKPCSLPKHDKARSRFICQTLYPVGYLILSIKKTAPNSGAVLFFNGAREET
jgi:hypothetical protein